MTGSDAEFENENLRPHVELQDGSGVETRLNGERMTYRDGHDAGYQTQINHDDGVLIVGISRQGIDATLLDSDEEEVIEDIELEKVQEDERLKLFEPTGDEYDFELTFHRTEVEDGAE